MSTSLPLGLPSRCLMGRSLYRDGLAARSVVQGCAQGQHGVIGLRTGSALALPTDTDLIFNVAQALTIGA